MIRRWLLLLAMLLMTLPVAAQSVVPMDLAYFQEAPTRCIAWDNLQVGGTRDLFVDDDCDNVYDSGTDYYLSEGQHETCTNDFASNRFNAASFDTTGTPFCVNLFDTNPDGPGCAVGQFLHAASTGAVGDIQCNQSITSAGAADMTLSPQGVDGKMRIHCDTNEDCWVETENIGSGDEFTLRTRAGRLRLSACDGSEGACSDDDIIFLDSVTLGGDLHLGLGGTLSGGTSADEDLFVKGDVTVLGTIFGTLSQFMQEQAAAASDLTAFGQFWVKNTTPNEAWFTDDAGTDVQLGTPHPTTANELSTQIGGETTGTSDFVRKTTPLVINPLLTLSTTTSANSGRIAYDATNDRIVVGDGITTDDFYSGPHSGSLCVDNDDDGNCEIDTDIEQELVLYDSDDDGNVDGWKSPKGFVARYNCQGDYVPIQYNLLGSATVLQQVGNTGACQSYTTASAGADAVFGYSVGNALTNAFNEADHDMVAMRMRIAATSVTTTTFRLAAGAFGGYASTNDALKVSMGVYFWCGAADDVDGDGTPSTGDDLMWWAVVSDFDTNHSGDICATKTGAQCATYTAVSTAAWNTEVSCDGASEWVTLGIIVDRVNLEAHFYVNDLFEATLSDTANGITTRGLGGLAWIWREHTDTTASRTYIDAIELFTELNN